LKEAATRRRTQMQTDVRDKEVVDLEQINGEEPESGVRRPTKMADPKLPSAFDIALREGPWEGDAPPHRGRQGECDR
jgi:hypothetical protein